MPSLRDVLLEQASNILRNGDLAMRLFSLDCGRAMARIELCCRCHIQPVDEIPCFGIDIGSERGAFEQHQFTAAQSRKEQ